jgi:hypothetical protein
VRTCYAVVQFKVMFAEVVMSISLGKHLELPRVMGSKALEFLKLIAFFGVDVEGKL